MHTLRRVWKEIRRGENIDVYLTIILAAGLSIVTITGIYSPTIESLTAILLGILALLSVANLKGRHATEQLSEKLSDSVKPVFLEEFPSSLGEDIISASDVWLVGVSLSRTIRSNYSEIERKLQRGHNVKFLLVHPDGPASEIAATRPYPRTGTEQTRRQIRDSLEYLCKLKAVNAKKLEVRTIENPLTHGIIAINPDSSMGTFYVEEYPYQTMGSELPRFILRTKDGHWYDFYKSELHNLWNSGVEWKCASS